MRQRQGHLQEQKSDIVLFDLEYLMRCKPINIPYDDALYK